MYYKLIYNVSKYITIVNEQYIIIMHYTNAYTLPECT